MKRFLLVMSLLLVGCCRKPMTEEYAAQYAHLNMCRHRMGTMEPSEYFLVIAVCARHLDYSCTQSLLQTLAKHPSDGSKSGDVGHAWIYVRGKQEGRCVELEGGHSGELGLCQPTYMEGVFKGIERGDPNPARYLWAVQRDGFFERGSGGYLPTFAAKIDLTEEQFHTIITYICSGKYPFQDYALAGFQCVRFVTEVAALAGLDLETQVTIPLEEYLKVGRARYPLWKDPKYSQITVLSPDRLEKSLIEAVCMGEAEYALSWYRQCRPHASRRPISSPLQTLYRFPKRYSRWRAFR